jgi:hypothetical protein
MVDIVYILGRGSRYRDRELEYSLQSVRCFLQNRGRIVIVGAHPRCQVFPPWQHVPMTDHHALPACNINDCLREACRSSQISETFLRVDDDCFLLKPADADLFPNYCRGTLHSHIEWFKTRPANPYATCLRTTEAWLTEQAFPTVNFEIHCPMLFQKTALLAILDRLNPVAGYLSRTIYGNIMKVPGVGISDSKINEPLTAGQIQARVHDRPFFSVGDKGLNKPMWDFLEATYNGGQRISGPIAG